ncbi:hypothetical protein ACWCQ1_23975 [Streptomyces sp. NPDC002144]
MDLAAHLRQLRELAGTPSIRTIERLIARQGRQDGMARSTIQEKLTGRSALKFPEILSIVEALAEHARLKDVPLPQSEIDQMVWRERFVRKSERTHHPTQLSNPINLYPKNKIEWNIEPLRQAQMIDLVAIVTESEDNSISTWLPTVLREMYRAEMDFTDYIKTASKDSPHGLAQTIAALEEEFPKTEPAGWAGGTWENDLTVGRLLQFAAELHGPTASPAVAAALRRSDLGTKVDVYLENVATWHLAKDIERAIDHLRAAGMERDARKLLGYVGSHRSSDRVVEVVVHFESANRIADRNVILGGVANHDLQRLGYVVPRLQKASAPEDVLMEVARGVPYGKHVEYAQHLEEAGLEEFAHLVRLAADELPF